MSGLINTENFSSLMLYLGVLGVIALVVFMILSFLKKESNSLAGILLSMIIFAIFLGVFEGPKIIQAKFKKPAEIAMTESKPTTPEPVPSQTAESAPVEPSAPAEPPAPEPAPMPSPEPEPVKTQPAPTPPKPGPTIVPEQVKPQPIPSPAPKPVQPAPAPAPTQPAPVAPTPAPTPTPAPAPATASEAPPPKTAPSGTHRMKIMPTAGGTGTIEISIKGPILEVAKEHKPSAHLMIVLDGKYALVILPTRSNEQKKENEFGESVLVSVTYFWEGVYAGFDNVPAGPHSVMIDVSLEGPETHKAKMTGSGNLDNDWNGFVTVPNGGSAQLVFGAKNWVNQELERIR